MIVLGVDGGTTKTIALASDESGCVLGWARGGGSNWTGEDVRVPMGVVAETARQALAKAGVSTAEEGVFCLAGADWPEDHTRRETVLVAAGVARKVAVKNDAFGGLRAGTSRPYGIVVAAGTGFNAAVIAPDGREWAYGYYETGGGGWDLAMQAFTAVLRAADGRGRPTCLTRKVLARLEFPDVESMLRAHSLGKIENPRLLSLCPLVFEAANEGDRVARGILSRQGRTLAEYVTALVRRYAFGKLAFEVVLAGGVFKGEGPTLMEAFTRAVRRSAPRAEIVLARHEPAVGALLLAYDAAGIAVTETVWANLERTAPPRAFYDTSDGSGLAAVR
jgi:N-acetylglucosamine kinase-like BadF-type ATPase